MIISIEELARQTVPVSKPEQAICPMKDCHNRGLYMSCYLDTNCLCSIYQSKYELLNTEQKRVLLGIR